MSINKLAFEKVNPSHPDKVADRIAGAIVDMAYKQTDNPHIAAEVLIGHGLCTIIVETDTVIDVEEIKKAVKRIAKIDNIDFNIKIIPQDKHLNEAQSEGAVCGDNGIFKGMPVSEIEQKLTDIVGHIYNAYPFDGKYLIEATGEYYMDYDISKMEPMYDITVCQSNTNGDNSTIMNFIPDLCDAVINPLGAWTGGIDVDSGATNRKLGSDMGEAVTGGGIQGKDLSKADVTLNIFAHIIANQENRPVTFKCNIGEDFTYGNLHYCDIIRIVKEYIDNIGGFEKLAEWGLIRPTDK